MTYCSQPERTSMLEWMYIPHTALRTPLMRKISGAPPRNKIAPNSIDWLMRISRECERDPDSQSTSLVEWWAS